jgi:hypothetical protein
MHFDQLTARHFESMQQQSIACEIYAEAVNTRTPCRVSTSMGSTNSRFPLGAPVNRPAKPALRPVAGRPNWFVDSRGVEHYIELPSRPATPSKTR